MAVCDQVPVPHVVHHVVRFHGAHGAIAGGRRVVAETQQLSLQQGGVTTLKVSGSVGLTPSSGRRRRPQALRAPAGWLPAGNLVVRSANNV